MIMKTYKIRIEMVMEVRFLVYFLVYGKNINLNNLIHHNQYPGCKAVSPMSHFFVSGFKAGDGYK